MFQCKFKNNCPHLNYTSIEQILAQRNYLSKRVDEMEALFNLGQNEVDKLKSQITQLEEENNHFKEEIVHLQQQPFKKLYHKKQNPTDETPHKKRGAPSGHPGHFRKTPQTIDEFVLVPLDKCPICSNINLSQINHRDNHIQQDIIIKKVITRCFIHLHYWCNICKKIVSGYAENELPKAPIGHVSKSIASFLRYEIKISYDDIARIFNNLFGLKITPAAIVGFDNKIHKSGLSLYNGLKNLLPYTSNIHADETGWKIDGYPAWLWTFTNKQLAFYHINSHRSGDVVKEHLGSSYNGILTSDFYSAYNNAIKAFAKQKCTTHLLRTGKELEEKFPNEPEVISFCENLKGLIQDALLLHSQYDKLPFEEYKSQKEELFLRLNQLSQIVVHHPKAETLRKRILKHKQEIFTFLNHPEIEPSNNRAERALRNSVLFRKITFGNRSNQGADNLSVITTIIQTAKLKCLDPKEVLQTLLIKGLTPELKLQFGIPQTRSP